MLLLCPVRPGDKNEELKYALRSWEANLILSSELELWTVGHKPDWLQPDHHIEGNRFRSAHFAVFDNILLGSHAADEAGHREVLYMNDDFFCLDPVGAILPVKRNCSLKDHIKQFPDNAGLWWPRSLRLTAEWLAEQGIENPDSYEVHRPLIADPALMAGTLAKFDTTGQDSVPQWRTMYGALNQIHAYPVSDVKLGVKTTGVGTPWISTADQTWPRYARIMQKRFQKPSQWEVA